MATAVQKAAGEVHKWQQTLSDLAEKDSKLELELTELEETARPLSLQVEVGSSNGNVKRLDRIRSEQEKLRRKRTDLNEARAEAALELERAQTHQAEAERDAERKRHQATAKKILEADLRAEAALAELAVALADRKAAILELPRKAPAVDSMLRAGLSVKCAVLSSGLGEHVALGHVEPRWQKPLRETDAGPLEQFLEGRWPPEEVNRG